MKITMLGISGSGKTAYMTAMSECFYRSQVGGYTIGNRENNFTSETFVYKNFDNIDTLTSGVFPDGTSSSVIMPLELRYKGNKVIDIDWIDYRGGAIKELSLGDIKEQNAELYATLIASDVVMVFADAAVLKVCKNEMIARSNLGAVEISTALKWVARKKHIDVIFLLTKMDSSIIDFHKDYEILRKRLGEVYSHFLTETDTSIYQYPVIAVGVAGAGNVITSYEWCNKEYDRQVLVFKHKIIHPNDLAMVNIASSFAHALLKCLESVKTQKNVNEFELEKELLSLEEKFGIVKNIIDILFNKSSKREQICDLKQAISSNRTEILNLESHEVRLRHLALNS